MEPTPPDPPACASSVPVAVRRGWVGVLAAAMGSVPAARALERAAFERARGGPDVAFMPSVPERQAAEAVAYSADCRRAHAALTDNGPALLARCGGDPALLLELDAAHLTEGTAVAAWVAKQEADRVYARAVLEEEEVVKEGVVRCRACRSFEGVSVNMVQRRSADEPMTVEWRCGRCGASGRING